jgi:hypothetical protein
MLRGMHRDDLLQKLKLRLEALGDLRDIRELGPVELRMKIPVQLAGVINGMHGTTFEKTYPHLVTNIGKRLRAVRLGDALDPQPRPSPEKE